MNGPFSTVSETSVGTGFPYVLVFASSRSAIHLKLTSPTLSTIGSSSSIPISEPTALKAS